MAGVFENKLPLILLSRVAPAAVARAVRFGDAGFSLFDSAAGSAFWPIRVPVAFPRKNAPDGGASRGEGGGNHFRPPATRTEAADATGAGRAGASAVPRFRFFPTKKGRRVEESESEGSLDKETGRFRLKGGNSDATPFS
jgi:hypothetical protein